MTNYPAPTAQIQGNQSMPLLTVIQLHTRSKAPLLLVTVCVVQASRWWSQAQWSEDCSATRDNYGRTENLLGQLQGAAPWIIRHSERQRPDLPLGAIGSWAHRTWVWSFGHFPAASARLTISPANARITALSVSQTAQFLPKMLGQYQRGLSNKRRVPGSKYSKEP